MSSAKWRDDVCLAAFLLLSGENASSSKYGGLLTMLSYDSFSVSCAKVQKSASRTSIFSLNMELFTFIKACFIAFTSLSIAVMIELSSP